MASTKRHSWSATPLIAGFVVVLFAATAAIVIEAEQRRAGVWLRHAFTVQADLASVQKLLLDAETGQRGYLLTGRDGYLAPFLAARGAVVPAVAKLAADTADDPRQARSNHRLATLAGLKIGELQQTVTLNQAGKTAEALFIVKNDTGNRAMAEMRDLLAAMGSEEGALLKRRAGDYQVWNGLSQLTLLITPLLILVLGAFAVLDGRRRFKELQVVNQHLEDEARIREHAESQVRQLQKMEAIGQLTGGIAHDFNNMLAIVLGSLDMARRRLTASADERALRYIDNAMDGAKRAATLTARLLAFSRQQPLEPRVLEANRLVASMSELFHRTLGERVVIETVLAAGLWRTRADPSQLENALLNLAVNARDAMPGGGKLTIETANCDLDERYVSDHEGLTAGSYTMISVTDNGSGMSPETVRRAFDPFFTTKEVGKGTGLGLSQVFGFVKQSGGHITIYSEVDKGTTVKVYLPRVLGEADASETVEAGEPPRGRAGETVLVVEDEDSVRHVAVDALRELGYTVIHANSGDEAKRKFASADHIDLLFTDVVMPKMTGRELAEDLQRQDGNLKVLYATGYTRNAIVHNGTLDAGTMLLTKPYPIGQLAIKVRQALDG